MDTHKSVDEEERLGVGGLNLPMKKEKHRDNLYSQRVQRAIQEKKKKKGAGGSGRGAGLDVGLQGQQHV